MHGMCLVSLGKFMDAESRGEPHTRALYRYEARNFVDAIHRGMRTHDSRYIYVNSVKKNNNFIKPIFNKPFFHLDVNY